MSGENRRDQLLTAGVELLKRRPHQDVSIEDIAATRVPKGLLGNRRQGAVSAGPSAAESAREWAAR